MTTDNTPTTPSAAHPKPTTKTGWKREAQDILLHGISTAKAYWSEQHSLLAEQMTPEETAMFDQLLDEQADRVARMFGYDHSW